jgi:hypothetical protein
MIFNLLNESSRPTHTQSDTDKCLNNRQLLFHISDRVFTNRGVRFLYRQIEFEHNKKGARLCHTCMLVLSMHRLYHTDDGLILWPNRFDSAYTHTHTKWRGALNQTITPQIIRFWMECLANDNSNIIFSVSLFSFIWHEFLINCRGTGSLVNWSHRQKHVILSYIRRWGGIFRMENPHFVFGCKENTH